METISAIGLIAYGVTKTHVFVRVPNERGRWLFTDRCVVDVVCRWCGAGIGEPCHNLRGGSARRYSTGTHVARRDDAHRQFGRGPRPAHKVRLAADDLAAPLQDPA
jgi:hypothetical protein